MIGIFDSGIGGITVLQKLIKLLPNEDYLYYSDSKNNPYGEKKADDLIKIVDNVVEYLINKKCKIIVIACNTASSICKNHLREKYNVPFIAIEPAIKIVHDLNLANNTLIMATKDTINSDNFNNLYHKYGHESKLCICKGLANLIENNKTDEIQIYLKKLLTKYKCVSNVVLGCTHYPLIKEEITEVLGNVHFFDGSDGVSRETKKVLSDNNLLSKNKNGSIQFFDSSFNKEKEAYFFNLLSKNNF